MANFNVLKVTTYEKNHCSEHVVAGCLLLIAISNSPCLANRRPWWNHKKRDADASLFYKSDLVIVYFR